MQFFLLFKFTISSPDQSNIGQRTGDTCFIGCCLDVNATIVEGTRWASGALAVSQVPAAAQPQSIPLSYQPYRDKGYGHQGSPPSCPTPSSGPAFPQTDQYRSCLVDLTSMRTFPLYTTKNLIARGTKERTQSSLPPQCAPFPVQVNGQRLQTDGATCPSKKE